MEGTPYIKVNFIKTNTSDPTRIVYSFLNKNYTILLPVTRARYLLAKHLMSKFYCRKFQITTFKS